MKLGTLPDLQPSTHELLQKLIDSGLVGDNYYELLAQDAEKRAPGLSQSIESYIDQAVLNTSRTLGLIEREKRSKETLNIGEGYCGGCGQVIIVKKGCEECTLLKTSYTD